MIWGACGFRSPRDKVVRTFRRGPINASGHRLAEGTSTMYCGTEKGGFLHIQKGHADDWEFDTSANWRITTDEAIDATLKHPQVVCYRDTNNTFTLGRILSEYDKKDGELTGRTKWANVTIDANSGRIVTAFPTSTKPRCTQ